MKNFKKIFNLSICCILAAAAILSCNSSKSFSQRHYNNRYYIGMSKKDASESVSTNETKETIKADQNQTTENTFVSPVTEDEKNNEMNETENVVAENSQKDDLKDGEGTKQSGTSLKNKTDKEDKFQEYPYSVIDTTLNEKVKAQTGSEGDVLSLVWIIIVVLLIFWALGLILGVGSVSLGYLIHILLVIALILLILWLLRVI